MSLNDILFDLTISNDLESKPNHGVCYANDLLQKKSRDVVAQPSNRHAIHTSHHVVPNPQRPKHDVEKGRAGD